MNNPLVSIIIPTYNRAHFIGETLESVLAQTYSNWECIVVDDGSFDYTEELMEFYNQKDARIQYYHRPNNKPKGANACRNYGFDLSKGDYVNWFDSDDVMFTEFLEKKLTLFLNNKDIDLVFCGFKVSGLNKNWHKIYQLNTYEKLIDIALYRNIKLNTPSFLYKRKLVVNSKFDENLTRAQDLDFVFKVISSVPYLNWKVYPFSLYRINLHSDTISYKFQKLEYLDFISEHTVLIRIKNFYKKRNDSINHKLSLKKIYFLRLKCLSTYNFRFYVHSILLSKILNRLDGFFLIYYLIYSLTGKGNYMMEKIIKKY